MADFVKPAAGSAPVAFRSNLEAALYWHGFGLKIVPIAPGEQCLAGALPQWLCEIDAKSVADFWSPRPDHGVGCYVGVAIVVFAADSWAATAALRRIEATVAVRPSLIVATAKGEQHYFRRRVQLILPSAADVREHPSTIAVRSGDSILLLPPTAGVSIKLIEVASAGDLAETTQDLIDAVFEHNRKPQRTRLDPYSLAGMAEDLERRAVDQVHVLGLLVLMGQAVVFYAAPNTGKTLLILWLLCQAIAAGRVDPARCYYLDCDDTSQGLAQKVRIADEYGFHVLADGLQGFSAAKFLGTLAEMAAQHQARGVIVILDTAKKFVDLMSKKDARDFTMIVRRFVASGGTLIALAHVNKYSRDGKPVYAGTSDIVDDFDCAYTIASLPSSEPGEKTVVFENIKRRGDVVREAAYAYTVEDGIGYEELLASVRPVDPERLEPLKLAAEVITDAELIGAIETCVREGIDTKMLLAVTAAKRTGASQRKALQVVEKYTGDDPARHRWRYTVHARGAKVFVLLDAAPRPG